MAISKNGVVHLPVPVTGQTPIYSDQLQSWAKQDYQELGIECYCLDAPLYILNGSTKFFYVCPQADASIR